MFARLTAKAILAAAAIAMAFFGIGLLGLALAHALVAALGVAGGYALAGAILLLPPLIWVLLGTFTQARKPPPPPPGNELMRTLIAAVARDKPWVAVVGTGLVSVVNMFLNRNTGSK
jgi:hypothetical protein